MMVTTGYILKGITQKKSERWAQKIMDWFANKKERESSPSSQTCGVGKK